MVKPSITLAITFLLSTGLIGPAYANAPVEFIKYFNPLQEKGYLNKAQDRSIKKQSFKSDQNALSPVANKELGFFAIVKTSDNNNVDYLNDLLSKPEVNGVSVTFSWQNIQSSEDNLQWASIDRILDLCAKYNKSAILRVSTCGLNETDASDTPKWVFDGGAKSLSYSGLDGKTHQLPVFWDTTYLARWDNFVSQLGERYDKNPNIHSIGITGVGMLGGNYVTPQALPAFKTNDKNAKAEEQKLASSLKTEYGMTQKKLIENNKYVIDMFAKAFPTARLNYDLDPPTTNRAGQDSLDEISDYAIRRYGQRIFLTRENVNDAKHGFDQYRLFLKFRPDTLTGLELTDAVNAQALSKIARYALDDGISYAEIPAAILTSSDAGIEAPLKYLAGHIGYQILAQQAKLPNQIVSGEPIKAAFTFLNLGASSPRRPARQMDKDVPASYRVELELKDASGKSVVISYHTPGTPTNTWPSGKPVSWEEELRMPSLNPGEYSVWMSVVDSETKRKISFIDLISSQEASPTVSVAVGKIKVLPVSRAIGSSDSQIK